jgi:hypothetical protein
VPRSHTSVWAAAPADDGTVVPLYFRARGDGDADAFPWMADDEFVLFEHASRDPVARVRLVVVESETPVTGRAYVVPVYVYSTYAATLLAPTTGT